MFGSASLLYVDVETFGGNWSKNDIKTKNDVKIIRMTSCTRVVLHSSYNTTFASPGRIHGNSGRYARKKFLS